MATDGGARASYTRPRLRLKSRVVLFELAVGMSRFDYQLAHELNKMGVDFLDIKTGRKIRIKKGKEWQ